MVTFTPVLFLVLAFSTQPHHVAMASMTTCIAIVISCGTTWWIYRIGRVPASRLADPDPEDLFYRQTPLLGGAGSMPLTSAIIFRMKFSSCSSTSQPRASAHHAASWCGLAQSTAT